jgi:hypothetical protein
MESGGLRVAPTADPQDGLLDLSIVENASRVLLAALGARASARSQVKPRLGESRSHADDPRRLRDILEDLERLLEVHRPRSDDSELSSRSADGLPRLLLSERRGEESSQGF